MKFNLKRAFTPLVCTAIGLLNLIFMSMNYVALFAAHSGERISYGFNAYACTAFGDGSVGNHLEIFLTSIGKDANLRFFLSISSLVLILLIIMSTILLIVGVFGLLKELFGFNWLDCVNSRVLQYIARRTLLVQGLLVGFSAMLTLITSIANLYTTYDVLFGLRPGIGWYFLLVFGVGAGVLSLLIPKIFKTTPPAPQKVYKCSECEAKADEGSEFCSACGAKVVEVEEDTSAEDLNGPVTLTDIKNMFVAIGTTILGFFKAKNIPLKKLGIICGGVVAVILLIVLLFNIPWPQPAM